MSRYNEIVILTPVDVSSSYAAVVDFGKYASDKLSVNVTIVGKSREVPNLKTIAPPMRGLLGLPLIRNVVLFGRLLKVLRGRNSLIVFNAVNQNSYFFEMLIVRLIRRVKICYYFTELWQDKALTSIKGRIAQRVIKPDFVVDVNNERQIHRNMYLKFNCKSEIIRNTCRVYKGGIKESNGIGVYTGKFSRDTMVSLEVLRSFRGGKSCIHWYTHVDDVSVFQREYKRELQASKITLFPRLDREILLETISNYEEGYVCYPHKNTESWNQKYAEPTKLFEYLSLGLNVVSFDNPTIASVIGSQSFLGVLVNTASGDNPVYKPNVHLDRVKRKEYFDDHLSFESDSENKIARLFEIK